MDPGVIQKLLSINRQFYSEFASEFSTTRYHPQPGFQRLFEIISSRCSSILDVGCGNGRLGHFLQEKGAGLAYLGVDSSAELLKIAESRVDGEFYHRDLMNRNCLEGLGRHDVVSCLATLQHIPTSEYRRHLVCEFANHLQPGGMIILSSWQFPDSERQMKKVVDWSNAGLHSDDVEENDYLMTWGALDTALRYVSYIDESEIAGMASSAGLRVSEQFRSDGREGDLNLYAILEPLT